MPEKIKRQLPTGVGGEKLKESRETLPAIEVANEVVWVNKNIELPFDLKVGEPSKLGMFLTPDPKPDEPKYYLEMRPEHRRSGILGRVIFKDKEGRLYRDIDLKGVGYAYRDYSRIRVHEPKKSYNPAYPDESKTTLGMLDRAYAENDIKMTERFLRAGIRTYRPIALIKIEEIVDLSGEKMSLEEAKNRGMLKKDDEPVVEARAFGTRARVADTINYNRIDPDSNVILEDAMKLVAQEQGIDPAKFTTEDYLAWFTKMMATNIARMHNRGWIHGYLTEHNITLDARIVDLDSVETLSEINERKRAGEDVHKSFKEDKDFAIEVLRNLQKFLEYFSLRRSDINVMGLFRITYNYNQKRKPKSNKT